MAKLYFYYAAMNAGKSTLLLQSAHNYNERGMTALILVPAIDDRYGQGKVTTRIGLQQDATVFDRQACLFTLVQSMLSATPQLHCVLIDEAQFLTQAQVWQLARIVDELKIPVLAYGLRTDFRAEPFEGSQYLLALADELVELKTICHCGKKAAMNMRVDQDGQAIREGEQVQIGGNESYVSTCRRHFVAGVGRAEQMRNNIKQEEVIL